MLHLPALIYDLGFILVTAAIVTLLFKKLRQPVVLGYLIAGFLVSPHVPFLPTVKDSENIKVWAEIGVIFLLFGLGLEFSFKKLAKVGKSASVTALVEILFMLGLGFFTGQLMGWSDMDSLFLGGILSISSTTIIVRAFDELGLKGRRFVSLVFGVLIVEDLVAILLLVLLSTVAVTQAVSGSELMSAAARLIFFLILWFIVGIYLLPMFLNRIRSLLTDETALIVGLGLCLMMVMLATEVGFSPALGAFVMGSILAETREGRRVEHLLIPVRDLFAAVFFVSVGMLIDPKILVQYADVIALITVITITGKLLSSGLGALLSGQSLRHSVQSGMSLAQIGEFSFIIATLGVSLKVTSDFLYPIAVAVSAITTFTTPYLIKYSDKAAAWIEQILPEPARERLNKYQSAVASRSGGSTASLIWQAYGLKIVLNSIVVIALFLGVSQLLLPRLMEGTDEKSWIPVIAGLATLALATPFLWAIVLGRPERSVAADARGADRLRELQFGISFGRVLIGLMLLGVLVSQFSSAQAASAIVLLTLAVPVFFLSRFAEPLYRSFEKRFIENLNDKEREELSRLPKLAPWNAALAEITLSPNSELVAKTLESSRLKERFGVTIALIERGHRRILSPGRDDLLLPADKLYLIGTDDQLALARKAIEADGQHLPNMAEETYGLESLMIKEGSVYAGRTIRECGLREAIQGLIVGIERHGQRTLSPDSTMTLAPHDVVWVVGDRQKIKKLDQRSQSPAASG